MTGSPAPDADRWPHTRGELAKRYGVARSTITRALALAHNAHQSDPAAHRPPPKPVNPDDAIPRYRLEEFDGFWAARPRPGRPRTPS